MASASHVDPANPPILDDDMNYEAWKKDLAVWETYTTTERKRRGGRLYLCLRGTARDKAREIPLEDISGNEGLDKIKAKLDEHYEKDKLQQLFLTIELFEKFNREGRSMKDFISDFESLNNKIKENGMVYPDGILGYKLLAQANLPEDKRDLIKATITELTYDNIKKALMSVFHDITTKSQYKKESHFKVEEPCYNKEALTMETLYIDKGKFRGRDNKGRMINRGRGFNGYDRGRGYNNCENRGRGYYTDNRGRIYENRGKGYNNENRGRGYTNENKGRNQNRGRGTARKLNPPDETGEISKCAICNSIYHWARNCPDSYENLNTYYSNCREDESEFESNEKMTLFCRESELPEIKIFNTDELEQNEEKNMLVKEALSTGVLDTGAPDNVAGEFWVTEYIKTLNNKEQNEIVRTASSKKYKFGNSEPVRAIENIKLPVVMANERIYLCTDVVKVNIPLLISKKAMQKVNAKLDYGENKLHIFGKTINLIESSSGHYLVPIQNHVQSENNEIYKLYFTENERDVKAKALKIHRHFSHARKERIRKLLEDAGIWSQEYSKALSEIEEKCKTCKLYKKPPMKPVVGFSYAQHFNDVISIDLKDFKHSNRKYKLLHIVDQATRFSQAIVVKSKQKEEILEAMFKVWIGVFGPPGKILSDNGGEFLNRDFIEMCDKFGIKVKMTAAEAPWGNGMCERHHKILCDTLEKTLEDVQDFQIALYWSVQAKNSLYNLHGFSPFILVFGRNPQLPNIIDGDLPSFENVTTSEYLAKNLNAMNKARQSFIRSESEEKVKRAIRHNVSGSADMKYVTGDRVFIKRREDNRWTGPGTVLGQEYQQILVRIGGFYYRVHPCRIILAEESQDKINSCMKDLQNSEDNNGLEKIDIGAKGIGSDGINRSVRLDFENEMEASNENSEDIGDMGNQENIEENEVIERDNEHVQENEQVQQVIGNENDEQIHHEQAQQEENQNPEQVLGKLLKPKRSELIEYTLNGATTRGVVMARQPKQSGMYKDWLNIKNIDGNELCVNFKDVTDWKVIDEEETEEVYICAEREEEEILEAKKQELNSWVKNKVFNEVRDTGQNKINVKWVIEERINDGNRRFKARLVAKGFQDTEETRNDSPTISKQNIRLLLMIAASRGWKCKSLDIRAAFLQGSPIERDVFLRPPAEFRKEGIIWKLNCCVYGLNQASRLWYLRIRKEFIKLGAESPKVDPAYFIWKHDKKVVGIVSSHVDDFLFTGDENFEKTTIKKLKEVFEISKEAKNTFVYLGVNLSTRGSYFTIDQIKYVQENLKPIKLSGIRRNNKSDLVNEDEKRNLRSCIGKLLWLVNQTRPDLGFETSVAASKVNNATVSELLEMNKLVKKAKATDIELKIPKLNNLENAKLLVFSDASFGNVSNGGSQAGYVVLVVDDERNCVVIHWGSHRIKRVVRSVLAAETMAMSDAVDMAYVINVMLSDMIFSDGRRLKIVCYTDSHSLSDAIRTSNTTKEKRLLIDIAALREAKDKEEIEVKWIETQKNIANPLTKKTPDSTSLMRVLNEGRIDC